MKSLEQYKFDRIKNSAQFIFVDLKGHVICSCDSIFDTTTKTPEIKEWMPLLESIMDFFSYQQNRNELVLKNQRISVIQSVLQSKRSLLNNQIKRFNRYGSIKKNFYEQISNNGNSERRGNGLMNGETTSYISEIENTINHLQDLVEELVILTNVNDISKFEKTEFEICGLLNQIIYNLVGESEFDFNLNVHSEIPEKLVGNVIYLKQIIIGLIKEFIKYDPEGLISISLEPATINEGTNYFIVEIKFQGLEMTNVQTPLSNYVDSKGQQQYNSLLYYGSELELKLSILQSFVDSHYGFLQCESNDTCDFFVAFSFQYEEQTNYS